MTSLRDRFHAVVDAWPALLGAVVFRYLTYALMTAMALWNELRPAPVLPDLVVSAVPFVPWVARLNYFAWLVLYLPLAIAFLVTEPRRWARYMVTGGLVSLARGVCIVLTGLGPPDPRHAGIGIAHATYLRAYTQLLSPIGVFTRGAAQAYLTKDLFFSGHTATTFLLVLYLWRRPALRAIAIVGHVVIVATVVFSHLHYGIDIVGAWAFTFALYALREWAPRGRAPQA